MKRPAFFRRWRVAAPLSTRGLLDMAFSLAHAGLLLLATLLLLNLSFTGGSEVSLFQRTLGVKRFVLKAGLPPEPGAFLFVNTAYDRQLIDKYDANHTFRIGNQDIADRRKLAQLFRAAGRGNRHTFIVCDIFFRDPSPDDADLLAAMPPVERLLIPYHASENGGYEYPLFSTIASGLGSYTTADANNTFLKFDLAKDATHKTIPLLMYEELHDAAFQWHPFLSSLHGKWSVNALIVYPRLLPSAANDSAGNPYLQLGELADMPEEAIRDILDKKIVVIGDFEERDQHPTVFGKIAGPLILLNAYLALESGDNIISSWFLLALFAMYALLSYNIFCEKNLEEREWVAKIHQKGVVGKLLLNWISYLFVFTFFSVTLSLFFNLHVNILLLATYLAVLDSAVRWFRQRRYRPLKAAL